MAETIEIRKPRGIALEVELPKSREMVKASALLSPEEVKRFRETGSIPIFDVGGMYFPATLDSEVPATSRKIREKDGTVWGIPAVTGG